MSRTRPASRTELISYAKRALGYPVIEINVDDDQVDDRVDEALQMFREFNSDAVEHAYISQLITSTDVSNEYLTTTSNVMSVVSILPIQEGDLSTSDLFSVQRQVRTDMAFDSSVTYTHYFLRSQHIALGEFLLNKSPTFDFVFHANRIVPKWDWGDDVTAGDYIVYEAYISLDENTVTGIWNDAWLKKYVIALIKLQWGTNLKKFTGVQLPGGIEFNGQTIYDEAMADIERLKEDLRTERESPPLGFLG